MPRKDEGIRLPAAPTKTLASRGAREATGCRDSVPGTARATTACVPAERQIAAISAIEATRRIKRMRAARRFRSTISYLCCELVLEVTRRERRPRHASPDDRARSLLDAGDS